MDAPEIILPVCSTNQMTFVADLGELKLNNEFVIKKLRDRSSMFDAMEFQLSKLKLYRAHITRTAGKHMARESYTGMVTTNPIFNGIVDG